MQIIIARLIKVFGLLILTGYSITILLTWIYFSSQGYIYLVAGEPNKFIMYFEWVLGLYGILIGLHYSKKEIDIIKNSNN